MSVTRQRPPSTVEITVGGMTCAGCVNSVTRALSRVPGVARVAVDLDSGRAHVEGTASPKALLAAVGKAGYDASLA